MDKDLELFKKQIEEDINLIKDDFIGNHRYNDENYVFNHWILDKIYLLDGELLSENITDQAADKEIDCYVHYPDLKELYIIQNKFYSNSNLKVPQLTKFLSQPLIELDCGNYQNKELQKIYNLAKNESEYKIFLYLYSTEEKFDDNLDIYIKNFNAKNQPDITAGIFSLSDLFNLYYKEYFHCRPEEFSFEFKNIHENHMLILSNLKDIMNDKFKEGYYIALPIIEIYNLYKEAKEKDYNLFDDNIREYLGNSSINGEIIRTLKSETERKNFFYYNNGITLTSRSNIKLPDTINFRNKSQQTRTIKLSNPQIINGCQTVNAIYSVLDNSDTLDDFKEAYVLLKILDFKSGDEFQDSKLHERIVECTNTQNAIKPSDFTKNKEYFKTIQDGLYDRGVLLEVRRSDKFRFSELSKNDKSNLNTKFINRYNLNLTRNQNIFSLEKMLLVYLSIVRDGYSAYTKKKDILKPKSEILENVSMQLHRLNSDNLIKMYIMFLRANNDKRESTDKKYIPYYMFSFIGDKLDRTSDDFYQRVNLFFDKIFKDTELYDNVYNYFMTLTDAYYKKYKKQRGFEYNQIIKKEIDPVIKNEVEDDISTYQALPHQIINSLFNEIVNTKF